MAEHDSEEVAEYVGWLRRPEWHPAWQQIGELMAAVYQTANFRMEDGSKVTATDCIPGAQREPKMQGLEEMEFILKAKAEASHA